MHCDLPLTSYTQLRPVTYRALCDLTHLFSFHYNRFCYLSDPPRRGWRSSNLSKSISFFALGPAPFRESQCARAFRDSTTSFARILRGSSGSPVRQCSAPNTQTTDIDKTKNVPRNMINNRGGNDFFSGTCAGSSTLTLGVSLASSTLASSYCSVRSSKTVSWIFARR